MYALIEVIHLLSRVLSVLIIVRAVLSWVSLDPRNPIVSLVVRATEPVLAPIRNLLPAGGGIDFSPLIALIAVQIFERLVVQVLISVA